MSDDKNVYAYVPKEGTKMHARLMEKIKDPQITYDCAVLGFMTEIYCKAHHKDREKHELESLLVDVGAYEHKSRLPKLCDECADHVRYGEIRRSLCMHKDGKPNCQDCEIHCYKPEEAKFQQTAMAYAGPRAIFHPIVAKDAVNHLTSHIKSKLEKKKKD